MQQRQKCVHARGDYILLPRALALLARIAEALCSRTESSQSSIFSKLYVPGTLFSQSFNFSSVPDVLCSRSSVLPEVWISEVLYIPETLCSPSFIFALFPVMFALFPKLCFFSVSSYVCSLPKALFLLCFQLCLLSSQSFIFARTLCFQSAIYSRNSVFLELSVSTVLLCSQTSVFGVVSEAVYVLECLYYSSSVFPELFLKRCLFPNLCVL